MTMSEQGSEIRVIPCYIPNNKGIGHFAVYAQTRSAPHEVLALDSLNLDTFGTCIEYHSWYLLWSAAHQKRIRFVIWCAALQFVLLFFGIGPGMYICLFSGGKLPNKNHRG
jgi:hypothetical protein